MKMITILLLTMLFTGDVLAQGAADEGHEYPWSQPLDECMAAGGLRTECFESLPPDILAQLEAWEAERGAIRRQQLQRRQQLENSTSFGVTESSDAEVLTFSSFRIEVGDGWGYNEMGELISIFHPDGSGILKIRSYSAPNVVDTDVLRNMTNVDQSTPLSWHDWGDFSGYQYDYTEGDSSYRQWWLVNRQTILFVVYESRVEPTDIDVHEIDRMVNSMTVNRS
jgi:hypothetical protein